PLGQLDALLGEERDLLLKEPLSKSNKSHSIGLVERIRQHALSTPNAPALREGSECLTYAELDQQSDIAALNLQYAGATPDSIVALCLPRSMELLVAILAVLKSGAAYLPLDPELPEARLQTIIEDANPEVLVVDNGNATGFVQDKSAVKRRVWKKLITEGLDDFNLDRLKTVDDCVKPDHLAYVLYTSGSTGKPKGVQVTHQNIAHYSLSAIEALQLPQAGHYGLISSLMADLGNTMLFPAWLQGGCVHLMGREESTDGAAFARYLRQYPLDCLKIVPSHLSALLTGSESGVEPEEVSGVLPKQVLVLGGERINGMLLTQLSECRTKSNSPKVFNHYGPTETTVGVLWQQLVLTNPDAALKGLLGDTRAYILDANLNPAISGQVAELYIAGPSVSRGYLRAADQTASCYLPDPFVAGERCYRTGDLAMRCAGGGIEIVGRADQQVKIRGFRLELEEIESLLASHATVQHSAVILQNAGEQAQLAAFVVPYAGGKVEVEHLKAWLVEQLPDYMVPSQTVAVSHLSLTANGKVDSIALLEQARQQAMRRYIAPRNELEAKICELWQEVLQQPEISVTDKFFDIGGHSLAAIKVVARMRQAFERELPTDLLFRMQTVEALAHYLDSDLSFTDSSSDDVSIKGEGNESNGLVPIRKAKNAKSTLVVMHSHGNHFVHYAPLLNKLHSEVEVFGLRSDPNIVTFNESEQFEHLISYYVTELTSLKDRDLTLAGWSLAGRQMAHLADRLIKEGFSIRSIAVIDYDPTQVLGNQDNELEQLSIDLSYYLAVNNINLTAEQESALNGMLSSENGKQSYSDVLKQLLKTSLLQSVLGEELPIESLYQSVVQRWVLKKLFYCTELPILSVPIWAWSSDDNRAGYEAWSHFTDVGFTGASIPSDHFSILSSQLLADQFNVLLNDRGIDQEKSEQQRHNDKELV
nr:non-ribosomal peptide synthetase [Acidiferrobacterales bacterium]